MDDRSCHCLGGSADSVSTIIRGCHKQSNEAVVFQGISPQCNSPFFLFVCISSAEHRAGEPVFHEYPSDIPFIIYGYINHICHMDASAHTDGLRPKFTRSASITRHSFHLMFLSAHSAYSFRPSSASGCSSSFIQRHWIRDLFT